MSVNKTSEDTNIATLSGGKSATNTNEIDSDNIGANAVE